MPNDHVYSVMRETFRQPRTIQITGWVDNQEVELPQDAGEVYLKHDGNHTLKLSLPVPIFGRRIKFFCALSGSADVQLYQNNGSSTIGSALATTATTTLTAGETVWYQAGDDLSDTVVAHGVRLDDLEDVVELENTLVVSAHTATRTIANNVVYATFTYSTSTAATQTVTLPTGESNIGKTLYVDCNLTGTDNITFNLGGAATIAGVKVGLYCFYCVAEGVWKRIPAPPRTVPTLAGELANTTIGNTVKAIAGALVAAGIVIDTTTVAT